MRAPQAAMWFPIMMFAISGFEHAIANMAFIPLGFMVGAGATVDYRVWLYQNLILVILGCALTQVQITTSLLHITSYMVYGSNGK
jgi:formate transporter